MPQKTRRKSAYALTRRSGTRMVKRSERRTRAARVKDLKAHYATVHTSSLLQHIVVLWLNVSESSIYLLLIAIPWFLFLLISDCSDPLGMVLLVEENNKVSLSPNKHVVCVNVSTVTRVVTDTPRHRPTMKCIILDLWSILEIGSRCVTDASALICLEVISGN